MANKSLDKIENLERIILNRSYIKSLENIKNFGGADVIISDQLTKELAEWLDNQPVVISLQNTSPRRRVIITQFSKELSWLFYELKKISSSQIGHISKYDFYGLLAETAKNYISENQKKQRLEDLLLTVIKKSKEILVI